MRVVDDGGIWSWEEEILVACISPPHEVWRFPVLMANLQDFAVTIMLAHVVPLDDNPVPDFRLHLGSLHCVEVSCSTHQAILHQSPRSLSLRSGSWGYPAARFTRCNAKARPSLGRWVSSSDRRNFLALRRSSGRRRLTAPKADERSAVACT